MTKLANTLERSQETESGSDILIEEVFEDIRKSRSAIDRLRESQLDRERRYLADCRRKRVLEKLAKEQFLDWESPENEAKEFVARMVNEHVQRVPNDYGDL